VRFDEKLKTLYDAAMAKGLWKECSAANSREAMWIAAVMAYFNAPFADSAPAGAAHPIGTRESLRDYDPALFALVDETMAYAGRTDWRFSP